MDTTITGSNVGPQNYESAEAENARMKVVFANRGEVTNPRHMVADQPLAPAPEVPAEDAAHAAAYVALDATHTVEKATSIAEEIAREKALADARLAELQAQTPAE